MSKKILAVVMAAAMAMPGLAGCQGKGTSTAATGGDNGAAPSAEATKITIEQNLCAMACQGCGAVLFLLKKQWNYFS